VFVSVYVVPVKEKKIIVFSFCLGFLVALP